MPVPQNARARRRARQKVGDVESIRSRTSRDELPSLSHLLELAHAVGSQAESTAADAERSRKRHKTAVRELIESGLLKLLQPSRFVGYESGFPGSSESARRWRAMRYHFRGFTALQHWWALSSVTVRSSRYFIVAPMS